MRCVRVNVGDNPDTQRRSATGLNRGLDTPDRQLLRLPEEGSDAEEPRTADEAGRQPSCRCSLYHGYRALSTLAIATSKRD